MKYKGGGEGVLEKLKVEGKKETQKTQTGRFRKMNKRSQEQWFVRSQSV